MKRRYNGLDLMKVFAAYFVVCAHVISNALDRINFLNASGELVKDFSYYFFTALRIFCTWAVPMFIMASGAFVLASPGTKDYRKFYGKAKGRILVPTVVFSIIYSIVYPCLYYFMGQFKEDGVRGALNMALTNLAKGAPAEHMWYMFTLIVLYLMAPFVVSMREMLGERNFAVAAVLLTVWGSIDNLASPPVLYWDLGFGANMLGIFMLGYVIRQWIGQEENGKKAALFILGGVAAGALQVVFKETLPVGTLYFVLSGKFPYAPLNIIMAACFLTAALLLPVQKDFGKPAAYTYWIYLAHPLFMMVLFVAGGAVTGKGFKGIAVTVPTFLLCSAIVFCLSYALGWLIERVLSGKQKKSLRKAGTQ